MMIVAIASAAPMAIVLLALIAIIAAALYPGRKDSQIIILVSIALLLFFYANSTSSPPAAEVSKPSKLEAEPFLTYYGQYSNLAVTGAGMERSIPLPHWISCPQDSGVSVETAIQKICGSGRVARYSSVGQSGGNRCGYNVIVGVCVSDAEK
jgi:hypothetical protein